MKKYFIAFKKRIKEFASGNISRIPKSNEKFINYLKHAGASIGEGTVFFSPSSTHVDVGKAFLIRIGKYCKITSGVMILAHDYSRSVARMKYHENVGGSAPVIIGNNVFIGVNAIILKGTHIGNNCIIGAGSIVGGVFPDDSVIAGNPAKVICSLDHYYKRRKEKVIDEACQCVNAIYQNTGKLPSIKQLGDGFAWLYLPRCEETFSSYPSFFDLSGDDEKLIKNDFLQTKPVFENYEAFIEYAIKQQNINIDL